MSKRYSKEWREKISRNHADVRGQKNPMWGKKRPQYVKNAISRANKGRKQINYVKPMLGKKHSLETKLRMRLAQLGAKGSGWKGGVTEEHQCIRTSSRYKNWRTSIFERDDYTCQICSKRGGYLQVDHIHSFSLFPELRFDLRNGRTLCIDCHKMTENYGYKLSNRTRKGILCQLSL